MTVSIGAATGDGASDGEAGALYTAADTALYAAKEGGRNQTRCAPSPVDRAKTEAFALRLAKA